MPDSNVTFPNADGERLTGILDLPVGKPRASALFAHCFTCSKDQKAAVRIARALSKAGVAVLRFDFTGLGQSDGDFADSNFSTNVSDLVAAANWLNTEIGGPDLLVGHSLGGTALLAAAEELPMSKAVATIGSPSTPAHLRRLLGAAESEIREDGAATVDLGGRPFKIRKQFVDDIEQHDLGARIGALRKPLIIFHAPLDDIVGIDNASELFLAAKHPKSFVSLDDADHLLSREQDARYVGEVLAAWASRYLPAAEATADSAVPDEATVATTAAGGFRTDIVSAGHALVADEPESAGGTNLGPSPYDLLSAALASCTTMTLQMYARHKKLDLDSVSVSVKHQKIHAKDCADCESDGGRIDEFAREISVTGDLDESQRQRLLEIADKCPVHRTLHGEVKVRSRLV